MDDKKDFLIKMTLRHFGKPGTLSFTKKKKCRGTSWLKYYGVVWHKRHYKRCGNVVNNFNFWSFGPSHDANLQVDIKVYDVANNNAAYLDQFTTKGHSSTVMRSVREVLPRLLSQIMECNFGAPNLVSMK